MSIRPFRDIKRKITKEINVGEVKIGGNNPISVQSMTNTLTKAIKKTVNQIHQISEVGAEIVRVSWPDKDSTKALKEASMIFGDTPIVNQLTPLESVLSILTLVTASVPVFKILTL